MSAMTPWERIQWALRAVPARETTASRTLLALVSHANDQGVAWPGRARIAALVFRVEEVKKHHKDKISKAIAWLEHEGLITVRRNSHKVGTAFVNEYRLNFRSPPGAPESHHRMVSTSERRRPPLVGAFVPPSDATPPPRSEGVPPHHPVEAEHPENIQENIHKKPPENKSQVRTKIVGRSTSGACRSPAERLTIEQVERIYRLIFRLSLRGRKIRGLVVTEDHMREVHMLSFKGGVARTPREFKDYLIERRDVLQELMDALPVEDLTALFERSG